MRSIGLISILFLACATMASAGQLTLCENNVTEGCELVIAASGLNSSGTLWERFCPMAEMGESPTDMPRCLEIAQGMFAGVKIQAYKDSGFSLVLPTAVTCHWAKDVDYAQLEGRTFYSRGQINRDTARVMFGPGITHHTSDDWGLNP